MQNVALTYELKSDWSNAGQSYKQLLRHQPGNADFQKKIAELAEKAVNYDPSRAFRCAGLPLVYVIKYAANRLGF